MRVYIKLGEESLEVEDPFFAQFLVENTAVFLENKMYRVESIKRVLIKAGNSLDSILEIYLS